MKQVIIDTNVIISFITDRNIQQQELAAKLLKSASGLKTSIICHQHVLTEFVYVLDRIYQIPKYRIKVLLSDFITMPGIEIIHEVYFKQLFKFWPEHVPDFGDAVLTQLSRIMRKAPVATFDQKLCSRLKTLDIKVFEFEKL